VTSQGRHRLCHDGEGELTQPWCARRRRALHVRQTMGHFNGAQLNGSCTRPEASAIFTPVAFKDSKGGIGDGISDWRHLNPTRATNHGAWAATNNHVKERWQVRQRVSPRTLPSLTGCRSTALLSHQRFSLRAPVARCDDKIRDEVRPPYATSNALL